MKKKMDETKNKVAYNIIYNGKRITIENMLGIPALGALKEDFFVFAEGYHEAMPSLPFLEWFSEKSGVKEYHVELDHFEQWFPNTCAETYSEDKYFPAYKPESPKILEILKKTGEWRITDTSRATLAHTFEATLPLEKIKELADRMYEFMDEPPGGHRITCDYFKITYIDGENMNLIWFDEKLKSFLPEPKLVLIGE